MLLVSTIAVAVGLASAQQPAVTPSVQNAPLGQVIPVDPLITVGTLANGLRYYVRANSQPQGRAELRLVVNAGSVLEDEDQRGLAHFVEHMSFNGTLHFPRQEVAGFMQSLGMRFGAHVNAHTSFDETVYELQIPSDNPAVIDRSLLILEDWAHNVSFDPVEIDKERGVILEEWRLGLGAGERMQDAQFPVLLKGSRYAERLPIGKPDIIQNVNHDRLKQFYIDWYRPDLMAVIAVGDFDRAAVEARIKAHFGSIPAASSPKPRPVYAVPDQPGTTYSVITDPEATATTIAAYGKMPARDQATVGAYRQQMVERLFSGMLSARLDEMAQKPDAPFLGAETDHQLFVRTEEATTLNALVAEGGVERGLAALFTEIERVARFGFTATELNRQRLNLQRFLEKAVVEKDKSPSGPLADEFIRNFTQGEPIPGIVYEFGLEPAFPSADHPCRDQQPGQGMDAGSQPLRRGERARERPGGAARRGKAGCRHQGGEQRTVDGLRRHRQHTAAARAAPRAGSHRRHLDERGHRHHRMAVVQRRPGRAQADDVQAGRNPVSSREPGRHVARERPGLHCGRDRRPGHRPGRPRQAHTSGPEQASRRHQRIGEGRHR